MNASLPPEDERRENQKDDTQQIAPSQVAPGIRPGRIVGLLLFVASVVILVLPMLQYRRVPAQRTTHAEMEQRQREIEQAAREASDEDGLADNR